MNMPRKHFTLTLDPEVVRRARAKSDNLSSTVDNLLRRFISESERESLKKSLDLYEKEARILRRRLGSFAEEYRKF